jgi:SAM-dependent methyltransferase
MRGASVDACEASPLAIENGRRLWSPALTIKWWEGDVRTAAFPETEYDLAIAYGLFHCFESSGEVEQTIAALKRALCSDGFLVICAFNDRCQDFRGAHAGFDPLLLSHSFYLGLLADCDVLVERDEDLVETHPHEGIEHSHSLSRIVARQNVA